MARVVSLTLAIVFALAAVVGSSIYGTLWYVARRDSNKQQRDENGKTQPAPRPPFPPPPMGAMQKPAIVDGVFRPNRLMGQKPPVTGFQIISRKDADMWLNDKELVIGVVVHGKARAYPINILTGPDREILNDELGDEPIAATW